MSIDNKLNTLPDGWNEWGRHVLKELERLNDCYEDIRKVQNSIEIEIGMLKVKSGIWGFAGAAIPIFIMFITEYLKKN